MTSDEIANLSTITTCYLNIQLGPFDDDQDAETEREGAQAFVSGSGDGSVVRAGLVSKGRGFESPQDRRECVYFSYLFFIFSRFNFLC